MTNSSAHLGTLADLCGTVAGEDLAPVVETASRFLRENDSVRRFRESRNDGSFASTRGRWADLSSLGLVAACAPDRCGGSDLSPVAGVLLAEAFGRALAPEPFVAGAFLPSLLLTLCENDEADQLLRQAASGVALPVVALQERTGPPTDEIETAIIGDGCGLRLTGTKRFVHAAPWATHFLVPARKNGGLCVALVESESEGVSLQPRVLADGTSSAELVLTDVALRAGQVIASDNRARDIIARVVDWAHLATSAELFGIATALFGMTIDYLKTRAQFDRPIGSFQALQHRAADLYCAKEIARFALAEAIQAYSAGTPPPGTASRCKARAAEAATKIGRESIQLHGAIGFSDEADVGLFVRRAMTLAAWMGGADGHRKQFAAVSPYAAD